MTHEEAFANAERAGVDGAFTRIDGEHPVGLYLGIESGQRALMVVCPEQPPDPPSLSAIHVEARPRHSGDWALVLRLEQRDLRLLFARLVEDLEDATRIRPLRPGEVVVERLLRWQRLLARRTGGRLDDRELRGLVAELSFLLDEAIPTAGVESATLCWRGPFCAPRDFVWPWVEVEVKALHNLQRETTISSLEQLSDTGVPLRLWCKTVDIAAGGDMGVVSAAELVERARALVGVSSVASERLEEALRSAGYEDREEYRARFFHLGTSTCYAVAARFPRIQRQDVAPGVVEGSYRLRIADLIPFVAPSWRDAASHAE